MVFAMFAAIVTAALGCAIALISVMMLGTAWMTTFGRDTETYWQTFVVADMRTFLANEVRFFSGDVGHFKTAWQLNNIAQINNMKTSLI